ncbi:hypothetical protein IMG5_162280 [Ichthyophthirius multifiliis]|uniref:Calcium-dependent protein kinase 1 n=1 Tax=Ichthyophthirius multifiliis TaxID=5932 RepID=G0R065_ICHMU|nr:hypothetical protein IMG5_162280 [Ichthyophthirius multifiliis]EGR29125.1 hypothetical protein IMG5_162280 [Ichthyophthirius multifiliis]|eukprot:XP_004030361.1 hypothetical protein IMG5_162280 [Ichthyophthirius multifiliis]
MSCMSEFSISPDIFIHLKQGTIQQNYKTGEILGEGAFGLVCKVTHKNTGMVRAMKTLKKSSVIKEEEERLFSEMNILKNLDHPNILKLIELFQDSKNYYLITEYCSGGELFDKIKSMKNFTEKMAADYFKQILSAVVYCHENQIVHRDIKPENLLFDTDKKDANLKVIDFGTSRKIDENKKMSKRLGTPYYIAPEVLDQNYDEKCDVWSCGVVLYILLCGYPPFTGKNEDEILKKVRLGKFKFDPEDWNHISEDAKNLIRKMLTYDSKKRISALQALNDNWVQKNAPAIPVNNKTLQNLSNFQSRSKIKQAIMTYIVSQMITQQEKQELQKNFMSLDQNGDGMLSKDELIQGYTSVCGNKELAIEQVERILDIVDCNKSGKVDFTEFLMAATNKDVVLSKQKMEQAFKIFDQDGNGNISREELSYIMGDIQDTFWQEILLECDTNKDGKISQNEFIELLLKKNF